MAASFFLPLLTRLTSDAAAVLFLSCHACAIVDKVLFDSQVESGNGKKGEKTAHQGQQKTSALLRVWPALKTKLLNAIHCLHVCYVMRALSVK